MNYQTQTLSNGLRVIHCDFSSLISYCGIVVNTGSRDEHPEEHGVAHFVEHLLFKGTQRRKAHHIANRMENIGGELNAYTTKEETFIYATFLTSYFSRATELLGDIVFNSIFPEKQIEREREVILDEINAYIDSPAELIYDDFENLLFSQHDMGHYILGSPESLCDIDKKAIRDFVERQYQPQKMVFFSYGKTPFSTVVRMAEKYFSAATQNMYTPKRRIPPTPNEPITDIIRKQTAQTHVIMGCRTYDMYHDRRFSLYLIHNILGGGSLNSRLNTSLREKHGLVYNVETNAVLYTDTGLFYIYFACDTKDKEKCIKLINKEIDKLKRTPLTPLQLSLAKKQWIGHMGIALENNENVALTTAKNFLHFNPILSFNAISSRIEAITSEQIQETANEVFNTPFSCLCYI